MNENLELILNQNPTDIQQKSAFNTQWQYSFVNRSAFYANITGQYRNYMLRWVQNYLWWYDGWCPYFHNESSGIFSTRLASALVNGAAKKVVGGRIFYKTRKQKNITKDEATGEYNVDKALHFISSDWAVKSNFAREVKKAVQFSAAAGTSLIKLDKAQGELKAKAFRFDSFYPTVGFDGKLIECYCFIRDFTKTANVGKDLNFTNYYVVEHRYFGDFVSVTGEKRCNVPLVEYIIKRSTGMVTTGQDYDVQGENIKFVDLPKQIRSSIGKAFSTVAFDKPMPLPFVDSIGAVLVNWTDCVSALPELPFGESLLTNIMPFLQSYDYYWSAFNTDLYLGRGKVILPKQMSKNTNTGEGQYNGFDSMLFVGIQGNPASPEQPKPLPVQFDLRATDWQTVRTTIIQNIAINTGLNLATIASFLQDTNAARTAREISTEESETALFVDDKREIIEKPLNELLSIVTKYYGFDDEVVIRWSASGLSNIYTRTDMIATALQNGFLSPQKAVRMFNQDDDEYQLKEEFDNIQASKESEFDYSALAEENPFNEENKTNGVDGNEEEDSASAVESASDYIRRSGSVN